MSDIKQTLIEKAIVKDLLVVEGSNEKRSVLSSEGNKP
jgi:hypothetical protein